MSTSKHTTPEEIAELRDEAFKYFTACNFEKAVRYQIEVINIQLQKNNAAELRDYKRLAFFYVSSGDSESAARLFTDLKGQLPHDLDLRARLALCLANIKRYQDAIQELEPVMASDSENIIALDTLVRCYGAINKPKLAKEFGRKSLLVKDREACSKGIVYKIPPGQPPEPDFNAPEENVLSFSLWGAEKRYILGALRNASLASELYHGWRCVFFCEETVPADVIKELQDLGAEVVMKTRQIRLFDGLFWRFEVISDPGIKRFLIRDCDSVINTRERIAVEEWLYSGKYFHVMRDYYTHSDLILAGMWGGTGGIFPPVAGLLEDMDKTLMRTRIIDQVFLRTYVWPTVRQSALIHDSQFKLPGSCDFPRLGVLPPGRHVGQDEFTASH